MAKGTVNRKMLSSLSREKLLQVLGHVCGSDAGLGTWAVTVCSGVSHRLHLASCPPRCFALNICFHDASVFSHMPISSILSRVPLELVKDSLGALGIDKTLRQVLVIGGGGREHALAWKLALSPKIGHVYVSPGNGGTAQTNRVSNAAIEISSPEAVAEFVRTTGVDLVIVGPEQPLVDGLVDYLEAAGISCFGPSAAAARLEASKAFSKKFMKRHGIPTARFEIFTNYEEAVAFVASGVFPRLVIKASGLAAGKGVLLPDSTEEANSALHQVRA